MTGCNGLDRPTPHLHANACCRTTQSHTQQGLLQTPLVWPGVQVSSACLPQPTQPDGRSVHVAQETRRDKGTTCIFSNMHSQPLTAVRPNPGHCMVPPSCMPHSSMAETPNAKMPDASHLQGQLCQTLACPGPLLNRARCTFRGSPCHMHYYTKTTLHIWFASPRNT